MSEQTEKVIRVGSRKSELALIQTKHVIGRLLELFPDRKFEIHTMSTMGDRVLNISLPKIGEKSLFTRDLEDALRRGGVDFVVHSLKDLPTSLPSGMTIGAVLEREDPRDAVVLNRKFEGRTLSTLPDGSVIGTSSLRRTAQLRRKYPHLDIVDIRGNLNTRLAKLDATTSKFAGIILAQAGLVRMGWNKRISQILEPLDVLYAVGQGALAVECRSNDENILTMLNELVCIETSCRILAERSFLKTLGGGCSAPVAVSTQMDGVFQNDNESSCNIEFIGAVWSLDGTVEIRGNTEKALFLKNIKADKLEKETQENDDGVSPRKRSKISESESEPINNGKNSPKIIDKDAIISNESGDAKTRTDVQYLINMHGELFKCCPYSSLHEKNAKKGNSSQKPDECPLKIPIGQDFMGKCPYVDVEQKVELSIDGKCPVTGRTVEDVKKSKENQDEIDNSGVDEAIVKKCPFTKDESKSKLHLKPDDCPFLQKNKIEMFDCDVNKTEEVKIISNLIDDTDSLFCGMYRHPCYSLDLFKQCEDMGITLAKNLIAQGALEVMQKAQNEIHGKI